MSRKIIAVDFDGTLFEDEFPNIGKPIYSVINRLKQEIEKGALIVLWTCREGQKLIEAIEMCKDYNIYFDSINSNPVQPKTNGMAKRKIYADEYWDNKAMNLEDICGLKK